MPSSGYSGTPLAKKLGIKEGHVIRVINEPANYFELFTDWPQTVSVTTDTITEKNLIHFFTTDVKNLIAILPLLKKEMKQNGAIWVSWPKKAAKIKTHVTEDVIRDYALQIGLVDVKVCAVDEVWSGLKLVIRVKERT